jgi:hypothetical protein
VCRLLTVADVVGYVLILFGGEPLERDERVS